MSLPNRFGTFFWKHSKALGSHCIYSVICIFSIMFYKGSLKLLNHLIREFKSVSQQPLYELNTLVCLLNSRHCFYYPVDKNKNRKRAITLLSCLIYGNKNEWWRKEEGKDREERTTVQQFHKYERFKVGIGRLEPGEDPFESVLIIDS